MDLESIYTAFFAHTYTQADARRRLNMLDIVYEEATYKTGEKKTIGDIIATKQMNDTDRAVLMKFLSTVKLPTSPIELKKVFNALKEEILHRPVVTLTIAFEPSAEQVMYYGEWFRKNVNPKALLIIIFSAHVIGGCSITWQGKQVTYDLEYLLKARRNEIVQIVQKYVDIKRKEKVI